MAEAVPTKSFLLVAGIDFGTTFSGYAYSFKNDPMKIQTNQGWNAGSEKLISFKTPTCVLVNPSKQFDSFGFEAENKYVDLADDKEHTGWLLFRWFKMILHNNEGLSRRAQVEAINGKRMPAMTIFTMAIRYMKDHLMRALKKQVPNIEQSDVMFVITVPAIWNDAAKQFMREAAVAGGINGDHIKLALEPEAASIWCQQVNVEKGLAFSMTGNKYMVVDLGGGTVDVSVHEKELDGTLKELHRPDGGPWGGTRVDSNYIAWLTTVFGEKVIEKFKKEAMGDYVDLLRDFENKKRNISSDTEGLITLRFPVALREFYEDLGEDDLAAKLARMNLKTDVKVQRDKLRVSAHIVRKWFEESIDKTVRHITGILSEPTMKDVNTILLVGGFGECQLVQEAVNKAVGRRTVIVPEEAGLAVLKGAVRFGHQPRFISSRCVKYTYGFASTLPFDENEDPQEKRIVDGYGNVRVKDIFAKVVEIGTTVDIDKSIRYPQEIHMNKNKEVHLEIYTSTESDPEYTTDPSCTKVGVLNLEKAPGQTHEDNMIDISFAFGGTELKVSVEILKTGKVMTKTIECL